MKLKVNFVLVHDDNKAIDNKYQITSFLNMLENENTWKEPYAANQRSERVKITLSKSHKVDCVSFFELVHRLSWTCMVIGIVNER